MSDLLKPETVGDSVFGLLYMGFFSSHAIYDRISYDDDISSILKCCITKSLTILVHRIFLYNNNECHHTSLFNRRKSIGTDETGALGFHVLKAAISDTVLLSKYIICYSKDLISYLRGTVSIKMISLNVKENFIKFSNNK